MPPSLSYQSGGCGRKGELEEELGEVVVGDSDTEEVRGPTEGVSPVSPGETEADGPVDDGPQAGVQPVLDEDVDGVLRPEVKLV